MHELDKSQPSFFFNLFHTPWQEYAGAGLDKKRSILQKIEQHGAKNCNWVHQLSNKTTAVDSTEEEVTTNFLTRPAFHFLGKSYAFFLNVFARAKIFEIQGVEVDGCTDQEKDDILDAILAEAQANFDYEVEVQKHPKFNCLNKYLFKYTEGKKNKTATTAEKVLESWTTNTKKLQLQNTPASSSAGPELLQGEPSESFKALNDSSKQLETLRNKLLKNQEELLLLLERVKTKDDSWKGKVTELEGSAAVLSKF